MNTIHEDQLSFLNSILQDAHAAHTYQLEDNKIYMISKLHAHKTTAFVANFQYMQRELTAWLDGAIAIALTFTTH